MRSRLKTLYYEQPSVHKRSIFEQVKAAGLSTRFLQSDSFNSQHMLTQTSVFQNTYASRKSYITLNYMWVHTICYTNVTDWQ